MIGAGIGGVAGAAIGSLVGGDDDYQDREITANELCAARYCEAYLRRYEMGGGSGLPRADELWPTGDAGADRRRPVQRHGHHGRGHGPECTTTVREEWVEVDSPEPLPRTPHHRPSTATEPARPFLCNKFWR